MENREDQNLVSDDMQVIFHTEPPRRKETLGGVSSRREIILTPALSSSAEGSRDREVGALWWCKEGGVGVEPGLRN